MEEIFLVLQNASSEDETLRNLSQDRIVAMIEDDSFPNLLLSVLATPEIGYGGYTCAIGALRLWFQRKWSQTTDGYKFEFISRYHLLMVVGHPIQKQLVGLYRSIRCVFSRCQIFDDFLFLLLDLIQQDVSYEILISSLLSLQVCIRSFINDIRVHPNTISELFGDLLGLYERLDKMWDLANSVDGFNILKHYLKVLVYCFNRIKLSNFHLESIYQIFVQINICPNSNYYKCKEYIQLIRTSSRVLRTVMGKMKFDHFDEVSPEMFRDYLDIVYDFWTKSILFGYNETIITNFSIPFVQEYKYLEISIDNTELLIKLCSLSYNDQLDFFENPYVFFEEAYPVYYCNETPRQVAISISDLLVSNSENFASFLLSLPISEPQIYIISSIIKHFRFYQLEPSIINIISEIFLNLFDNYIFISTFLLLLKSCWCFCDDDIRKQSYDLAIECINSDSIVLISNAIKLLKTVFKSGYYVSYDIVDHIVSFASYCPSADVSLLVFYYIQKHGYNDIAIIHKAFSLFVFSLINAFNSSEYTDLNKSCVEKISRIMISFIQDFGNILHYEELIELFLDITNFNNNNYIYYFSSLLSEITCYTESVSVVYIKLLSDLQTKDSLFVSIFYLKYPILKLILHNEPLFSRLCVSDSIVTLGMKAMDMNCAPRMDYDGAIISSMVIFRDHNICLDEMVEFLFSIDRSISFAWSLVVASIILFRGLCFPPGFFEEFISIEYLNEIKYRHEALLILLSLVKSKELYPFYSDQINDRILELFKAYNDLKNDFQVELDDIYPFNVNISQYIQ